MSKHFVNEKALRYMEYLNRETDNRHHTPEEDGYQYDLLKAGDPRAAEEHIRVMFSSSLTGKVSEDPIRNIKYLTVAGATLASRAAIEAGMDSERAYNISDLYIQKMDLLQTMEELKTLNEDMFLFYAKEIANLDKRKVYSKPIILSLDFIYHNLYRQISVEELAEEGTSLSGYRISLYVSLPLNNWGDVTHL